MKVKYISNSQIAISVILKSGKSVHVRFDPITGNQSVYYTDNPEFQEAMENHPRYGQLFRKDVAFTDAPVVKPKQEKKVEGSITKISVSCLEDAKDYLADKYGVSRTQLRSEAKIKEKALALGIEFVGL